MKKRKNISDIKIVFFDVDGTLIDIHEKTMSEKMLVTLKMLKERNTILCLSTGRGPDYLPSFPGIEFDAFVTYNGAYCYDKKEVIFRNTIPKEEVKKILYNAAAINRAISVATVNRVAVNGEDEDLIEYFSFGKMKIDPCENFEELARGEVYQLAMGCCPEEYDAVMKGVTHAKIVAWWDRAVDIIPATGGKGLGVEKVLEHYHLSKEQAIAFGDGENDIEMLQAVGLGVAMGNSSNQVKEAADYVCECVEDDGIYYYCLNHGLI